MRVSAAVTSRPGAGSLVCGAMWAGWRRGWAADGGQWAAADIACARVGGRSVSAAMLRIAIRMRRNERTWSCGQVFWAANCLRNWPGAKEEAGWLWAAAAFVPRLHDSKESS